MIGQSTFGRATIQNSLPVEFGNLQYRITVGTSLRPNGKNRQRTPDSQPTDDWGIRPDEGLEVPITADKSAELRRQADLHGLRPADSREALPFDDPAEDPFRLEALKYLRLKLGADELTRHRARRVIQYSAFSSIEPGAFHAPRHHPHATRSPRLRRDPGRLRRPPRHRPRPADVLKHLLAASPAVRKAAAEAAASPRTR